MHIHAYILHILISGRLSAVVCNTGRQAHAVALRMAVVFVCVYVHCAASNVQCARVYRYIDDHLLR